MADRDSPAAIDKILNVTKQEKIFVIGQSMGGTILFSFLSEHTEYNDKVRSVASVESAQLDFFPASRNLELFQRTIKLRHMLWLCDYSVIHIFSLSVCICFIRFSSMEPWFPS